MSIDKKSVSPRLPPPSLLVLGITSTTAVSLKLLSGKLCKFFLKVDVYSGSYLFLFFAVNLL